MTDHEFYETLDRMWADLLRSLDDDFNDAVAVGDLDEAEKLVDEGFALADLLEAGRPRLRATVH